jgi:hypothetical protein
VSTPVEGLVVPVRVEALLLADADQGDSHFSPPAAVFSRLPSYGDRTGRVYLSDTVVTEPFSAVALTPGIHLHWTLPRALRHADAGEEGTVSLPAAPDRWLVVRAITDGATGSTTTRAFVVESDYVAADATYSDTTIPWQSPEMTGNTWRYLGRVYDYADWVANGGHGTYLPEPLNAMGYGALDFSAFYPNCANVFGMYDGSLRSDFDARSQSLSYTVVGWYADSADDPLTGTSLSGTSNAFGWLFEDHGGTRSPGYTVMLGSVRSLDWNPRRPGGYFPDAGDPAAVSVSLGNTAPEALSALVSDLVAGEKLPEVERLLNAVQLGMLPTLGRPGGAAEFEEALFGAGYDALQGGTAWAVQPRTGERPVALGRDAIELLRALNAAQSTADANEREITTLRRQIFADWTKFMVIQHSGLTGLPPLSDVHDYLSDEMDALARAVRAREDALNDVASRARSVEALLPTTQELVSAPSGRFYRPADPVLLLAGKDAPVPAPDQAPTLGCVLTGDLPTEISLPAGLVTGSAACVLEAAWVPAFGDLSVLPWPGIEAAWRAAVLLNGDTVPGLVALLAANGPTESPASLDAPATRATLEAAQLAWLAASTPENGITFNGPPPQGDVVMRVWALPWNPIALSWRMDFEPLVSLGPGGSEAYLPDTVVTKLRFDRETFDYSYPDGTTFSGAVQSYQGVVLLSSGATTELRTQVARYLRYNDDPELRQILGDLEDVPALAQAVGGFHDALLMMEMVLQMAVYDPAAISRLYQDFSNAAVAGAVGAENQHTPRTGFPYNPLRAGKAAVRSLVMTDAFGRWKTVPVDRLVVSETIRTTPAASGPELLLPARLAQAARLDFRWLAASDAQAATGNVEDTPICGWVVPNHLDGSLAFYDADGDMIGTLFGGGSDQGTLYWMDAPGSASAGTDIRAAFERANPVLRGFALGTHGNGAGYVRDLIRTFDRTQTWVVPTGFQQDASTSVLLGTPIALVQASLALELGGLPSPDQSYLALEADMRADDPVVRTVRGFPEIRFPALLGSLSELNDGLYGFFLPDARAPGGYTFTRFYAEGAEPGSPDIVPAAPTTVTVAAGDARPLALAMLVDPRAEVHAHTGILPVQTLGLPSAMYAAAVARLRFTFLAAPVLWTSEGVALPVPAGGDGTWGWTERSGAGWTSSEIGVQSQKATLQNAAQAAEGWLVLSRKDNP